MKRVTDAQLFELFDKPVPWKKDLDTNHQWIAKFTIGKIDYSFQANFQPEGSLYDIDTWSITFGASNLPQDTGHFKDPLGITDTGNQFVVFATVKDLLLAFIAEKQPKTFEYSAAEPSRKKLYQHFSKSLVRVIPYTYEYDSTYGDFTFTRND